MGDLIGQVIRGYEVKERIGSGGFGVVYRAFQPAVEREVAIKVILPERAKSEYFVKRFDAEAHLVANLEHPYIVPLYDYWQDDDRVCLVMRWLHGGSLREALSAGPLNKESLTHLVRQIGEALSLAHQQGIVHRDIKPDNILLDEQGNYFLTDFGIAKDLKGEISSVTSSGMVTGTPAYLSPEQGMAKSVTNRSDIYSFGVVLYEVLTGDHPFPEADPTTQILHHISDPLPPLSEKRPDLSDAFDEIIQTATAKEAGDRFESIVDLVADFQMAQDTGEIKVRKAISGILEKKLGVQAFTPSFLDSEKESDLNRKELFVGREKQIEILDAYLEGCLSGEGQLVLVTGEAGRGKSALIDEFARRAALEHEGLLLAKGACNVYTGAAEPYLPFRQIIAMLTGDVEAQWSSGEISTELALGLWDLLPDICTDLVEHGQNLLGTLVSNRELAERAAGYGSDGTEWQTNLANHLTGTGKLGEGAEVDQIQIYQEYIHVLKKVAKEQPILLLLDDLHWIDQASAGLFAYLVSEIRSSRIMIVGAYRLDEIRTNREGQAHFLEEELSEIKRRFGDIWINLDNSEKADNLAFVNAYLDSQSNKFGDNFRKEFANHTEGHGLFVKELLLDMQEHGDLVIDKDGVWTEGSNLRWQRIPARVEGVIEKRIERLDEDSRQVLEVASIEGVEFTAEVVAGVLERDARKLTRHLSRQLGREHRLLEDIGITKVNSTRLAHFRFQHDLIQKYLYQYLGESERTLLHEDVGLKMEELHGDHTDRIAAQLARHFDLAGNGVRAIKYYMQAGDQASDVYAYAQAAESYQQAVRLLKEEGDEERAARVLMTLGLTYHMSSEFEASRRAYDEGFTILKESDSHRIGAAMPPAPRSLTILGGSPRSFDPSKGGDTTATFYFDQLFSGLATIDSNNEVVPDVAERWEISEGGRRYVFYLREDVFWSDGVQVTADDFVYAWRRVLDPSTESPTANILQVVKNGRAILQGNLSDVNKLGVRALDPRTLEVKLEEPTYYFPYLIAFSVCYPVPKHSVMKHEEKWAHPKNLITNGPFMLVSIKGDEKVELERNLNYHGNYSGNVNKVNILLTRFSSAQLLESYENNTIDVLGLESLEPKEQAIAKRRFRKETLVEPALATYLIEFNIRKPPFDDLRVRHAFAHATDKETLASIELEGRHSPAIGGFVPPGAAGHSADIGLSFEPDKARELLAQAGYPGGKGFPQLAGMILPWLPRQTGPFLRTLWKEILGIDIHWENVSVEEYFKLMAGQLPNIILSGWVADYPDAHSFLQSSEFVEYTGWDNHRVIEILREAVSSNDMQARYGLYRKADELIMNEAPIVPILYPRLQHLINPDVTYSASVPQQSLKSAVIKPEADDG